MPTPSVLSLTHVRRRGSARRGTGGYAPPARPPPPSARALRAAPIPLRIAHLFAAVAAYLPAADRAELRACCRALKRLLPLHLRLYVPPPSSVPVSAVEAALAQAEHTASLDLRLDSPAAAADAALVNLALSLPTAPATRAAGVLRELRVAVDCTLTRQQPSHVVPMIFAAAGAAAALRRLDVRMMVNQHDPAPLMRLLVSWLAQTLRRLPDLDAASVRVLNRYNYNQHRGATALRVSRPRGAGADAEWEEQRTGPVRGWGAGPAAAAAPDAAGAAALRRAFAAVGGPPACGVEFVWEQRPEMLCKGQLFG